MNDDVAKIRRALSRSQVGVYSVDRATLAPTDYREEPAHHLDREALQSLDVLAGRVRQLEATLEATRTGYRDNVRDGATATELVTYLVGRLDALAAALSDRGQA